MTATTQPGDALAAPLAAAVRLGFAAWFLARPEVPARALGVPDRPALRRVAHVVAARELVLGTGTLAALAAGRRTDGWVRAMAVADAVNGSCVLAATLLGQVPGRRGLGLAAFDLSGTLSELWLARRLARD
ncbi:hypothetical protein [Vallicoccus soli]|uniref:DUF4267 domain-containing protein n=1 Tax=Vallicoccus soli TaxID=2339232 RepID=A0A3A3YVU0_9ACTN|nr:hypothetical protein [Vallicoccus soli]RJK94807.1 hypothetical protein D5H78_13390 [Vallicoccus soli]